MLPQTTQRLAADLAALRRLAANSSILQLDAVGDAPERLAITLQGRGLHVSSQHQALELAEVHEAVLRLPHGYPQQAPDIQWLVPLAHPNISYSGLVELDDIGLPWDAALDLAVVVERLWDVVRLAYVNSDRIVNQSVYRLLNEQTYWRLPVDPRRLCDRAAQPLVNVVHYRRRGGTPVMDVASKDNSLLIIDESTAAPADWRSGAAGGGDNVLYIGDDD